MKKMLLLSVILYASNVWAYDFEVDGICYTVSSFEKYTVAVDGLNESVSGIIDIPSQITYSGKMFTVTSISSIRSKNIDSVIIPSTVTSIKDYAFAGSSIKELVIPNNVSTIGNGICQNCQSLITISMSSNVAYLKHYSFKGCISLEKFDWHPNSTYATIGPRAFEGCTSLSFFTIPAGVSSTGGTWDGSVPYRLIAFYGCTSLDSLFIEDSKKKLYFGGDDMDGRKMEFSGSAIKYLYLGRDYVKNDSYGVPSFGSVEHLVIGDSVLCLTNWPSGNIKTLEIGSQLSSVKNFSSNTALEYIKIKRKTPPTANGFSNFNFINTVLYVPKGCKPVYESSEIWKNFWNILEYDDGGSTDVETKKCAKPTINYSYGKLSFYCDTEGVAYHSTITDFDIASYNTNEVQLDVTYNISVYATKTGYDNSDVATATLCWIDVEPKTEGLGDDIAQVRAKAILIQSMDGQIAISGIDDGTRIYAYEVNGQQVGSAISHNGQANLTTNLKPGSIVIIKIGDRSVKATIK